MPSNNSDRKIETPKWFSAFAGSVGGLVEACCLQPLDVTKTRLQLDKVGKYNGMFNALSTIKKEEGARALYKGLTPFVTHLTVKYALRLYSYEAYRGLLRNGDEELGTAKTLLAGLMAGCTEAVLIVTPFEVVKMRLQQQVGVDISKLKYRGPIHCATTVVKEEGPTALLKGVVPTTIRQGSNQMFLFFSVAEFNDRVWGKKRGDGVTLPLWKTLITGAVAGAVGPIANCPMDVIKTRLQCQGVNEAPRYTGTMNAFTTILKEEGPAALYKGLSIRLLRTAPGQAIMWTVVGRLTSMYEAYELERLEKEDPNYTIKLPATATI